MKLSTREKEVLVEIRRAKSNRQIGDALNICEGTVKTHVSNILRKLNVTSRVAAAVSNV